MIILYTLSVAIIIALWIISCPRKPAIPEAIVVGLCEVCQSVILEDDDYVAYRESDPGVIICRHCTADRQGE